MHASNGFAIVSIVYLGLSMAPGEGATKFQPIFPPVGVGDRSALYLYFLLLAEL